MIVGCKKDLWTKSFVLAPSVLGKKISLLKAKKPKSTAIHLLPDDLLLFIFGFFATPDLARVSKVCVRFQRLISSNLAKFPQHHSFFVSQGEVKVVIQ